MKILLCIEVTIRVIEEDALEELHLHPGYIFKAFYTIQKKLFSAAT